MAEITIPKNSLNLPETIWWENGELFLLDQTQLPLAVVGERQDTIEQVSDSIKALKVRGAPAIGVAGAYGLLVGIKVHQDLPVDDFMAQIESKAAWLGEARPTAVNLKWGLKRMVDFAKQQRVTTSRELYDKLEGEAIDIHNEDRELCRMIGVHGASLIQPGYGILTHCNAGSLATSEYGTATSPMFVAHKNQIPFRVYADETRPLLQGARLTSWELQQAGIDVTLITDNMAAHMMSQGLIDLVIVGTDRTAANGDVANKIGTLGVAILAKHFNIPFYVALPYSTIDFNMPDGSGIPIEERDPIEVTHFGSRRTAPENIQVRSPAFDVTPHELVAGLITERGIIRPPFKENLLSEYGEK
ncbi:MAG: S-methyl-5-thioribose-1-phosphate isomerase [Verrucomicrobia bacterium]|nr:S-methyl-5-thioribose-1-phosphate isomerase [Verrucomicrobiota bacterium]MDA1065339.1 S-methyl-5-thioribose-1-phosphate isomerase [Verrucomicrobiota bacterium]